MVAWGDVSTVLNGVVKGDRFSNGVPQLDTSSSSILRQDRIDWHSSLIEHSKDKQ